MMALVIIICTLAGVTEAYEPAQRTMREPLPAGCIGLQDVVRLPVVGVVRGPEMDVQGDAMWIVRLKGDAFTIVWDDPRGRRS